MPATRSVFRAPTAGRFAARLNAIMGDVRLLWLPSTGDVLAAPDLGGDGGPAITQSASLAGRLSARGGGAAVSFNGTSEYASLLDSDSLSFGNGTADQAFSAVVLANVTDTAANRALACKWNATGSQREWILYVLTTDLLQFQVRDESAAVSPVRVSDGVITQGAWQLFGVTYSGVGGATAAAGVTLYANGAVLASTPTEQVTYVAMENGTGSLEIGSFSAGTAGFMSGSLALVAVCAKALTAAEHLAIKHLVNAHFWLAL